MDLLEKREKYNACTASTQSQLEAADIFKGQYSDPSRISHYSSKCAYFQGLDNTADKIIFYIVSIKGKEEMCELNFVHLDLKDCSTSFHIKIAPMEVELPGKIITRDKGMPKFTGLKMNGWNLGQIELSMLEFTSAQGLSLKYSKVKIQSILFRDSTKDSYALIEVDECPSVQISDSTFKNMVINNGSSGAVRIRNSKDSKIERCVFEQNSGQYGGGLHLYNVETFLIKDTNFNQNTAAEGGGLYVRQVKTKGTVLNGDFFGNKMSSLGGGAIFKDCEELEMNGTTFRENGSTVREADGNGMKLSEIKKARLSNMLFEKAKCHAGCYANGGGIDGSYVSDIVMDKMTFRDNIQRYGAGFDFYQSEVFTLTNSVFHNCVTSFKGGAIYFRNSYDFSKMATIFIQNVNITDSSTLVNGGGFHFENINAESALLQNVRIERNFANESGGGLYFVNNKNIILDNWHFYDNKVDLNQEVNNGGAIFAQDLVNCTLKNSVFKNNVAKQGQAVFCLAKCNSFKMINVDFRDHQTYGTMLLQDSIDVTLDDVKMSESNSKGNGAGLLALKITQLNILNSRFSNLDSVSGGAIYIQESKNINLIKTTLYKNTAQLIGGGIVITDSNIIVMNEFKLVENSAKKIGGAAQFINSRDIKFLKGEVESNESKLSTGGLMFQDGENIKIEESVFKKNKAWSQGGALLFSSCYDVNLKSVDIMDHSTSRYGGGLLLYLSNVINFTKITLTNNMSTANDGGAIFVDSCKFFYFRELTVELNTGQSGGGLYIQGSSDFEISSSSLNKNTARVQGGAMIIKESKHGKILKSNINENTSTTAGGGIVFEQCTNILIDEAGFVQNNCIQGEGGALLFNNKCSSIKLKAMKMHQNSAPASGGAIQISYIQDIDIQDSVVSENVSQGNGVGVYINNVDKVNLENCRIKNHKYWEQNEVVQGTGIYGKIIKEITIINSSFTENASNYQGGAIYLAQVDDIKVKQSTFDQNQVNKKNSKEINGGGLYAVNTKNFFMEKSEVKNCFSSYSGGGIFLKNVEIAQFSNSKFSNNSAFFNSSIFLYKKNQEYRTTFGGGIYYEPRDILNSTKIQVEMNDVIFSECKASSGGGAFFALRPDQKLELQVYNLIFEKNMADIGPAIRMIGKNLQYLEQKMTIKDNNNIISYKNNKGLVAPEQAYFKYYKNEYQPDLKYSQFELCSRDTYLKEGGSLFCHKCSEKAVCEGGYIPIYPKEKYWRNTEGDEYSFQKCEISINACLGNDTCQVGFTGVLCENCDFSLGYAPLSGTCEKCSDEYKVIVRMLFMFIVSLLILFNQIYGVKKRISRKLLQQTMNLLFNFPYGNVSQLSGVMKIFIMHFQVMYLAATYYLNIPFQITGFISIIGNPYESLSLSLNCLIVKNSNFEAKKMDYYISFYGILITMALIVLIVFFQIISYMFKQFIKDKQILIQYIKCSIICFFLTIQPGILQNALSFISCRKILNKSYSSADTNIDCATSFYKNDVFPINLVVSICFGILIPIFIAFLLIRGNKLKKLKMISYQRSYGILYMEMKHEKYYFELVSFGTKLLVVLVSIFYAQQIIIKGCLLILILSAYSILCLRVKPYFTNALNRLSQMATNTQNVTIILILCIYELQDNKNYLYLVSITLIGVFNGIFVLTCMSIVIKDYRIFVRYLFVFEFRFLNGFKKKYIQQMEKEKQAKLRWKRIKLAIHETTLILREGIAMKNNYQEYLNRHIIQHLSKDQFNQANSLNRVPFNQIYNVNSSNIMSDEDYQRIQKLSESVVNSSSFRNETGNQHLQAKATFQPVQDISSSSFLKQGLKLSQFHSHQNNNTTLRYSEQPNDILQESDESNLRKDSEKNDEDQHQQQILPTPKADQKNSIKPSQDVQLIFSHSTFTPKNDSINNNNNSNNNNNIINKTTYSNGSGEGGQNDKDSVENSIMKNPQQQQQQQYFQIPKQQFHLILDPYEQQDVSCSYREQEENYISLGESSLRQQQSHYKSLNIYNNESLDNSFYQSKMRDKSSKRVNLTPNMGDASDVIFFS